MSNLRLDKWNAGILEYCEDLKEKICIKPIIDGLVKSLKRLFSVIPAQVPLLAGYFHVVRIFWIPVFTGMTTFYDSIIIPSFQLR
jgi:hypothetical protein